MKRLEAKLASLRQKEEGIFMPFLVLGDPDRATSIALAEALVRAGADVLEFGFAFSDPPADGPVIQAADQRALAGGVTPSSSFEMLAELRKKTELPFTLLVYWNIVLRFGIEAFYRRAAEVGVDAVLVADLPIEEAKESLRAAKAAGIAPIFIVSERTTPARLERVLAVAEGYLYVVAHLGVTGARQAIDPRLAETIASLRGKTQLPLLAGFGISSPDHVQRVLASGAEGAIVGSALIAEAAKHLDDPKAMIAGVEDLARELKSATRRLLLA
jgi:tryptophan synthase alpha chain